MQLILLSSGWKQDPNLKRHEDAKLFRLVVQDRLQESHERKEELRAKVVPLALDKRPEAKALMSRLLLACIFGCMPFGAIVFLLILWHTSVWVRWL